MSVLPPIQGHTETRAALTRAALQGELPGSLLIHGPAGVGKQRLGLWLAQLLACHEPTALGPCESCAACRLAGRLEHPDIHWFFPLPRPKGASGPDKLAEALEDARAAELAARREDPWRITVPGEPVGIFLAQVQTIRRLSSIRPAMGRRQTFIIGDAERLVPQESSPEAANALLKVLEEPPADTTFILTAGSPDAILPTIRSRLLPVRLRPLSEEEVMRFLVEHRGVRDEMASTAARLSGGSIGRSLGFLPSGDEPGPYEALRRRARELLAAATSQSATPRLAAAHALPPTGARGSFVDLLEFLAVWLRDLAAVANGAPELATNVDATSFLQDLARRTPGAVTAIPDALRTVGEAQELAQGNVNPQLILARLLTKLHEQLSGRA